MMHEMDNMRFARRKPDCLTDPSENECIAGMRLSLGHHIAAFSVKYTP